MIEASHEFGTRERPRNEGRGRKAVQLLGKVPNAFAVSMILLPLLVRPAPRVTLIVIRESVGWGLTYIAEALIA